MRFGETAAAISTPPGKGGVDDVGCVRENGGKQKGDGEHVPILPN